MTPPPQNAPIAFFAFNRPRHAERTLRALSACPEAIESDLHVFVDGPRSPDEKRLTDETWEIARSAAGFRSVRAHRSVANAGLFHSITSGISSILSNNASVIVVEDDILVAPGYLRYMNCGLAKYEHDSRVGSIHGYVPPLPGIPESFFLRGGDCWGWATWKDRWEVFSADATSLLAAIVKRGLLEQFASTHGWQSVVQLAKRVQGRSQSWAILWHASLFLHQMHTLHPPRSLVHNIGNDGSGTHARSGSLNDTAFLAHDTGPMPTNVVQDEFAAHALSTFLDTNAVSRMPLPLFVSRLLLKVYSRFEVKRALMDPRKQ